MADSGETQVERIPGFSERPLGAGFAGILEGPAGDRGELRRLARRLAELDLAEADLELEGARFSLLMGEAPLEGTKITAEKLEAVTDLLAEMVRSSPRPEAVESTLRCNVYFRTEVLEIAFAAAGGMIRCASRRRPATREDLARVPVTAAAPVLPHDFPRRKALLIGGLLLGVFLFLAWQRGYMDRLFRADAAAFALETGEFGDLLELTAANDWGRYRVEVTRGPRYPADPAAATRLEEEARTNAERAAVGAVVEGRSIYARLLDGEGRTLAALPLELRPLVADPAGKVTTYLPGRMGGASIRLSFDAGRQD